MKTRRVIYKQRQFTGSPPHHQFVDMGEANFHAWGVSYDELDGGPGNFSTAILELDDGVVINVPVECIRFLYIEEMELADKVKEKLHK